MNNVLSVWDCQGQLSQAADISYSVNPFSGSDTSRSPRARSVFNSRQIPSENTGLLNRTERPELSTRVRRKLFLRCDTKSYQFKRKSLNLRFSHRYFGRTLSLQSTSRDLPLAVPPLPSDKPYEQAAPVTTTGDSSPVTTTVPRDAPKVILHQALVDGTSDTSTSTAQHVDSPLKVQASPPRTSKNGGNKGEGGGERDTCNKSQKKEEQQKQTIQVAREKWIPNSKVDLRVGMKSLFEEGDDWMNEEEFWTVCT